MEMIKFVPLANEMKKNPELKKSDIESLREWCSKQPHLPEISDSELALFLHSNYYHIEATKKTIDSFCTCRTLVPEFFSNRDPIGTKELRVAFNTACIVTLDSPTTEGYKVIYSRLVNFEPSNWNFNDMLKYFNMVLDIWMYTEGTTDGHLIVVDFHGVTLGHATRLSPMGIRKYLYYLQEGLPVRLKGLHYLNATPIVDILLKMMRPFMKQSLMDVFHVHTTMDTVSAFIPLEIFPNEAGGQAGPLETFHKSQIKKLENYRAWFEVEEASARVDETLRPVKEKSPKDLFGVEGSFKELDID